MVGYFRQTLATIPETHVFPAPTTRAKCAAMQKRLRKSVQGSLSRRSLVVFEGVEGVDAETVPENSVSINVPSLKPSKGGAWMGMRRKSKSKIDVDVAKKHGNNDPVCGKKSAIEDWTSDPCWKVPSDGFSSGHPLLSRCGGKTWKTAKASISGKGRQIKYALATRPLSIFKDCARRITYTLPTGTDSKSFEQLKRSYKIM